MRLSHTVLAAVTTLLCACTSACTSPSGADPASEGASRPGLPSPSSSATPLPMWPDPAADPGAPRRGSSLVAGWTEQGHLVVFSAATGEVLAEAAGAAAGEQRDLVVDPWLSRIVLLDEA